MSVKTCSKCKTAFTCQNETSGCWCESVSLSTTALAYLKANFNNCLCKSCLTEYSQPKPLIEDPAKD